MALPPGTTIGPYEVTATLGAGGMGEVYLAHDSRLKRDVALKLLPESFATDPERRCCMNTRCGWGGVARTSRDPPQEPHYGDEVEGSSQV